MYTICTECIHNRVCKMKNDVDRALIQIQNNNSVSILGITDSGIQISVNCSERELRKTNGSK